MKYIQMFFTALLNRTSTFKEKWKKLSLGQKIKRIIILLVGLALLLVVVDWFSPRTIVGIDRTYITKSVKGEDLYDPQVFTTETTTQNGPNGVLVTVTYPKSGQQDLDEVIAQKAADFAESVAKTAQNNTTYNQNSFVYGKKVFVTFTNNDPASTAPAFETFGFTRSGELSPELFTKPGYEDVIQNAVANTLQTNFEFQTEISKKLALEALNNNDYRLASNGLVLQIPMNKLPKAITGASYYEVLIPIELIKDFIE